MTTFDFDPDWVVAPGETLVSWFNEQGFAANDRRVHLADRYGITPVELHAFLDGGPLTEELAIRIAAMTHISKALWLALEQNFRVGLAAGKTWTR